MGDLPVFGCVPSCLNNLVNASRSQEMQKSNAFSVEAKLIDTCEDACPEHHSRLGCEGPINQS